MSHRETVRTVVALATIAALTLVGMSASAGSAAAVGLPSCLDQTWTGPSGYISVRTSPNGTLAWGVKDYVDNSGVWNVQVFVNKKRFDAKPNYTYNPHGSIPASAAPSGSIVSFVVDHVDSRGNRSRNVPNGCIVP